MARKRKKKQEDDDPAGSWMDTYSDMMTLLLCFFAIMFNPDEITEEQMAQIRNSMELVGIASFLPGGRTVSSGNLQDRGGSFDTLPSASPGSTVGEAARVSRDAVSAQVKSLFASESRSRRVIITTDERGVVISLLSGLAFRPGSDHINMDETRDILWRLGAYMSSEGVADMKFKIEGHTDDAELLPDGPFASSWQLSAARAISVLSFLSDIGVDDRKGEISGFGDTMPMYAGETPEARAYSRRVDIVLMPSDIDTF
jgi:chemotaxis protein MotB